MPLNEKAALGGAANLETSSQGSLDLVHSFAGDDPTVCLDYVRARLGLPAFTPQGGAPPRKPAAGTHQVRHGGP